MSMRRMVAVLLVSAGLAAWRAAADAGPGPQVAVRAEAIVLDQLTARLDTMLARPLDPRSARDLLETSRGLPEGSLREAVLHAAAVALIGAGETASGQALANHLSQAYPASRYRERLAEVATATPAGRACGPACGKDCPVCGGSGAPPPSPALKSMVEECRYLIRNRIRVLQEEAGSADVRDSGRSLTPPELKPALKAFADWMLLQQRRLETRIVTRLYATREGPAAVLHMHVTPGFTGQAYDWRLAIAKACVKDWAVKCRDLDATAGFRLYDADGMIVGEFNYRSWRLWLPKDGEPPREPSAPAEPPAGGAPAGESVPLEPATAAPAPQP